MLKNYDTVLEFMDIHQDWFENDCGSRIFYSASGYTKSGYTSDFEFGEALLNICFDPEINFNPFENLNYIPDYYLNNYSNTPSTIILSDDLVEIGYGAFGNCINLTEIKCNSTTVGRLHAAAFLNCIKLKYIPFTIFGNISSECFSGCSALQKIDLSPKITAIDQQAFYNCKTLSTITLPKNLRHIGAKAFYNCISLPEIMDIPASTEYIGENAFQGCTCKFRYKRKIYTNINDIIEQL